MLSQHNDNACNSLLGTYSRSDILLPVKYLMQMKCVCKSWNTLISEPFFVKMHLKEYNTVKMHLNYQVMKRSARNPNLALPIRKRQKYTTPWFCGVVPIPYQYLIYSRINQSPLLGYHPRSGFLIGSYNGLLHFREPQSTRLYPNGVKIRKTYFRISNPATRKVSIILGSFK